jgi:hypothetical protein
MYLLSGWTDASIISSVAARKNKKEGRRYTNSVDYAVNEQFFQKKAVSATSDAFIT